MKNEDPDFERVQQCFIEVLNNLGKKGLAAKAKEATTKTELQELKRATGTGSPLFRLLQQCSNIPPVEKVQTEKPIKGTFADDKEFQRVKVCFIENHNKAGRRDLADLAKKATTKADLEALMNAAGTDSNLSRQLNECWNNPYGPENQYSNFDL